MNKINGFKIKIKNNSFVKSVLTLSSGVIIGQIINFFGMPIISRIYSPVIIGDYTSVTTTANVICAIACLGMMTVFMLPDKDEEARNLSKLVSLSTVVIVIIIIVLMWIAFPNYKVFAVTSITYSTALITLGLYCILYTISNICYAYVNRKKQYRVLFWNPVISSIANVVIGTILGIMGMGYLGYMLSHILGFVINIIHLVMHENPYDKIVGSKLYYWQLLKKYKQFPIFQMPANIISNLRGQIQVQMLANLFSSYSLGMYSMALRILTIPITLLATPINRVYYQEANMRYNKGENIGEFSFNILKANIKIAIVPIGILVIFGELIFSVFLGSQWREAGTYAAVLGLYQLMIFCSNCLSGGFVIIGKNFLNLFTSLYNLLAIGIVYLIAYNWDISIMTCLWVMNFFGISGMLLSQGIFFKLTGVKIRKYIIFILQYIILPFIVSWVIRSLIY